MDVGEKLVELRKEAAHYAICTCSAFQHCEDCPYRKYGTECRDNIEMEYLLKNGVTVQGWISVKDRLPEESGEYLAYCGEYDGICVLYHEVLKTKSKWRTQWKKVTHWMPLPQPPKGE